MELRVTELLVRSDFGFNFSTLTIYPAFLTSIWLWLYAGSGFLLKAVRRFDIGLEWFNRRFDIEKKPLLSIGLVAGASGPVLGGSDREQNHLTATGGHDMSYLRGHQVGSAPATQIFIGKTRWDAGGARAWLTPGFG
jgi:hypothetical protein